MDLHLTSYGAKIRVKQGLFVVKYFDEERIPHKEEYAPSELDCIWIYPPTSLSAQVIRLAQDHDIDVIFTDQRDVPIGHYVSYTPRGSSKVQKAQLFVSISPELSFSFVQELTFDKIQSQANLLARLAEKRGDDTALLAAIDIIQAQSRKVQSASGVLDNKMKASLRGWEGVSSRTFYAALSRLLPNRYRFNGRSRRPAKDAFNAFLNYAFALLYAETERALVRAGIHPIIGFMHRDGYRLKSMVYDFIEPFRSDTVWVVYQLFSRNKVNLNRHISDLGSRIDLATEGKRLLIPAWNSYYKEQRKQAFGMRMIRREIIGRRAELLASQLLSATKSKPHESMDYV
ncbi:MAG: CRISPR-associated endonuclease Cas1 [Bacteroidota bacterium]